MRDPPSCSKLQSTRPRDKGAPNNVGIVRKANDPRIKTESGRNSDDLGKL